MSDNGDVRCSFCGKRQEQVQKMIAGPEGAAICDECTDVCADVLDDVLGDWRRQVVDPVRSAKQLADPLPEHRGEIVQRLPDGSLAVPALEALVESGYGVRSGTGMPDAGLWAILDRDHPSYETFRHYLDDYERQRGG